MRIFLFFLLFAILGATSCKEKTIESTDIPVTLNNGEITPNPLFKEISSSSSNLLFSNSITENVEDLNNLFNFDYFYNGAGVGIEDLNNDGLLDIFFCGNQVDNKLFINKGNLVFEDVTESAGINHGKIWSNGITFVDINQDGWMDIYISQGGPNQRQQRKNLLFINSKNGSFEEKAEEYGLADMGISTQSVFFDYDNDNDLDCLVMNENELYGVDPINLFRLSAQNKETKYFNSSHLYRNDGGIFVDTTKESGLERPIFGLGLSVSDINDDGWLDFYIASDYYIPDALFINNQDGSFSDQIKEYTNQISFYGMGMDIADINNDNLQDIFVLDMAANDHIRSKTLMASMNTKRFDYLVNKANFHHQYMYNSLQLNTGFGKYSNIAQSTAMANTDWSWSVLMSDLDLDGDKDIYITNGYRKYALDNDLQQQVYRAKLKYKNRVPLEVKKNLYAQMPSEKLPNILFENLGDFNFTENAQIWGLGNQSFSNGAGLGDLDNDGDMDLVVNNIDENCFLYQNMAVEHQKGSYLKVKANSPLSESFPKIKITYGDKSQFIESRRVRGYRSSHENIAHFGLGKAKKVDTVTVLWPDGKIQHSYNVEANSTLVLNKKNATKPKKTSKLQAKTIFKKINAQDIGIDITHKENVYDDFENEILLPYKQSTLGPSISKGYLNDDKLIDFFIGGASGQAGGIYLQSKNGKFYKKSNPILLNDKDYEDMESVIFDWDNDGDMDLFVVSGGNEFSHHSSFYADRLYINDGTGKMAKLNTDVFQRNPKVGKSVTTLDFDNDGDQDIFVGNRIVAQSYPNHVSSTIFENRNGEPVDVTDNIAPQLKDFGIVNSIIATDYDQDGWQDFIAVGEWTGIGIFKNEKGKFRNINADYKVLEQKGWWFSVKETDINNDGLPDYLVGNAGTNLKFKASSKNPFKVFANDFDKNGTPDIVLGQNYNGKLVPVRGRECSSQQMPFIQQKFKTYSAFANASLTDIYGEKLVSAYEAQATEFKSVLLINKGDGKFDLTYLPNEAQFFPIMDSVFMDINNDGIEDAIVAGNIYNTEVETPRLDAPSGLVLISNGKNGYTTVPWNHSGILLNSNIKDLELLKNSKETILFGIQNNEPLKAFILNQ